VSLANLNYFEIFSQPVSFQVAENDLEKEYRKLQGQYHPDKFSTASDHERLQALQHTSLINDAYDTLKSPLKRAAYLLKLEGIDPEEHNQAHLNEDFLLKQLELREALESLVENEHMDELLALKSSITEEKQIALENFESVFGSDQFIEAKFLYNQLQFLFKLLDEIDRAEERLLDY